MKKLLITLLSLLFSLPSIARDFTYEYEGQTLTYTVIDEEAKTCMTKAGGMSENNDVLPGNNVAGDLVIPSEASDGESVYTVTSIGDYAFYLCNELTSVTIPESVTSIGAYAFMCASLPKTEFRSIEALCNIDFHDYYSNPMFTSHNLFINGEEITELVIPESVNSIGVYTFAGCSNLTSVKIPENVLSIYYAAFNGCTGLTKAEFSSIEALCNLDFIGSYSNPLFYAHNLYINGKEIADVIIPETVTSIGNNAFQGASGLTSVTIPESVTSIGYDVFSSCTGLTSITIPESVTSIGPTAFYNCTGLTSISIPNNITTIESGTFYGCSGLTSISIPNSVTSIESQAFKECSNLTSISIPAGVISIGHDAFGYCSLEKAEFASIEALCNISFASSSSNPISYAESLYINSEKITELIIPESITSIGQYAFNFCKGLTSVTLPNSLISIGRNAFNFCLDLKSVYYDTSDPIIGDMSVFDYVYNKATLFVPTEAINKCKEIEPWKYFFNIEAYDFSNVEDVIVEIDETLPYDIFNLNGMKVSNNIEDLNPGIYIVRQGSKIKKINIK